MRKQVLAFVFVLVASVVVAQEQLTVTIYPEVGEDGGPIQWKDMVQGVIPGTIAAKVHGLEAEDEAIGEEAGAKEA